MNGLLFMSVKSSHYQTFSDWFFKTVVRMKCTLCSTQNSLLIFRSVLSNSSLPNMRSTFKINLNFPEVETDQDFIYLVFLYSSSVCLLQKSDIWLLHLHFAMSTWWLHHSFVMWTAWGRQVCLLDLNTFKKSLFDAVRCEKLLSKELTC